MADPRVTTAAAALLALVTLPLTAQQPLTREIFVTVADNAGAPVLDLTGGDFEVIENGVPRTVVRVAIGDAPMRIVLLVDSSTAVASMLRDMRNALTAFVDALPPGHEVGVRREGTHVQTSRGRTF